jgi:hypothetical protein
MDNNDKIIEQSIGRMKRHKWKDGNICLKCGLERKRMALTKDLRSFGHYLYEFKVGEQWIFNTPSCI